MAWQAIPQMSFLLKTLWFILLLSHSISGQSLPTTAQALGTLGDGADGLGNGNSNVSVSAYNAEVPDIDSPIMLDLPWPSDCHVKSVDPFTHNQVRELIERHSKLVEYKLVFPNYTYNPLRTNTTWSYQADDWARMTNLHGETLLTLAFNYGVMSLMTLSFGVEFMEVELTDAPAGCLGKLGEDTKIQTILHLLMRDFKESGSLTFDGDDRVCHEVIRDKDGYAQFKDRCCFIDRVHAKQSCASSTRNIWLVVIYLLLAVVWFLVLFCGPLMVTSMVINNAQESVPYVVKLGEPLKRTLFLAREDTPVEVSYRFKLDLRRQGGLPKLHESAMNMPKGQVIEAQISEYDIYVNYRKLLPENMVPVGLLSCLARSIFKMKMKNLSPCKPCCDANMLQPYSSRAPAPWIELWTRVGKALSILLIPSLLYIRLAVFYLYEHEEVADRKAATYKLDLRDTFEHSLIHYLGPTHPLLVFVYVVCVFAAAVLAYFGTHEKGSYFKRIIVSSFKDLQKMSWLKAMEVSVSNMLWPFRRFGLMGCLVALVYWPVALLLCLIIWTVYVLPTFYLTYRLLYHAGQGILGNIRKKKTKYQVQDTTDRSISAFEIDNVIARFCSSDDNKGKHAEEAALLQHRESKLKEMSGVSNKQKIVEHVLAAILLILAMFGSLILLAECLGFLVEVLVFTLMGIIMNAGSMLKFITLILLVIVYSYDTYNNVGKKYLKLNKALFGEIKHRISNLSDVTSLPSSLQVNCGFKSVENSQQKDHEKPDNPAKDVARHWMINDLILFIDSEDMPRIPQALFDEVCQIRVAGSPGPVYASLITATYDFLKIVCFLVFVFLIVLSFGQVYQVSATNQSLATMAGGFLPLILRNFMQPRRPDIEFGTVSFKSKLEEIIQNFRQNWPIFDFPFEEPSEEESEDEEDSGSDEEGDRKENSPGKEKRERSGKMWPMFDYALEAALESQSEEDDYSSDAPKQVKKKRKPKDTKKKKKLKKGTEKAKDEEDGVNKKPDNEAEEVKVKVPEAAGDEGGDEEEEDAEDHYDVDILVLLPEASRGRWLQELADIELDELNEDGVPLEVNDNSMVKMV